MEKLLNIIESEFFEQLENADVLILGKDSESREFFRYISSCGISAENTPAKDKEYDVIVNFGDMHINPNKRLKTRGILALVNSSHSLIRPAKCCKALKILNLSS